MALLHGGDVGPVAQVVVRATHELIRTPAEDRLARLRCVRDRHQGVARGVQRHHVGREGQEHLVLPKVIAQRALQLVEVRVVARDAHKAARRRFGRCDRPQVRPIRLPKPQLVADAVRGRIVIFRSQHIVVNALEIRQVIWVEVVARGLANHVFGRVPEQRAARW